MLFKFYANESSSLYRDILDNCPAILININPHVTYFLYYFITIASEHVYKLKALSLETHYTYLPNNYVPSLYFMPVSSYVTQCIRSNIDF